MAVLDCMLMNGLHLWNMSCSKVEGRQLMTRYGFMEAVAHELLYYKTDTMISPEKRRKEGRQSPERPGFEKEANEHEIFDVGHRKRCIVCSTETAIYVWQEKKRKQKVNTEHNKVYKGGRRRVSRCRQCQFNAHNFIQENDQKLIHGWFPGKTCMQIVHSEAGREIWNLPSGTRKRITCNHKHPIIKEIRKTIQERFDNG